LGRGDDIFRPGWGRWSGVMRFFAPRGGAVHWLRTTTLDFAPGLLDQSTPYCFSNVHGDLGLKIRKHEL